MALADWQLIGCIALWVFLVRTLYGRLVLAGRLGTPLFAAITVWVTSPVLLAAMVVFGENRSLADFTRVGSMPWLLIFGDVVVLPLAAALCALAVRAACPATLPGRGAYWFCLALGVTAGLMFHIWDAGNYGRLGLSALADSASKTLHDVLIYPVLLGGFMYMNLLIYRVVRAIGVRKAALNWRVLGYVACLLVWVALAWRDTAAGLDPRDFHTACDVACAAGNINQRLGWLNGVVDAVRSVLQSWQIM